MSVFVVVGGVDSQGERWNFVRYQCLFVVVGGVDSQGETGRTLLGVSVCWLWWKVLTAKVRQAGLC